MAEAAKPRIIQDGIFAGRELSSLSEDEFKQIILAIPKEADCKAGQSLMLYILKKKGPQAFISFVEWGQNTIQENGRIEKSDFQVQTYEEKEMLRKAMPGGLISRRKLLLYLIPAAATVSLTAKKVGTGSFGSLEDSSLEICGAIILVNELIELVKDFEPKKFEEISSAVTTISDTIGIGTYTPTYKLPATGTALGR